MISPPQYYLKFLFTLVLLSLPVQQCCCARGEEKHISPISSSQFEASLTASATRGSAIAVSFDDKVGAVVLVTTGGRKDDNVKLHDQEDDDSLIAELSPNVHCCMTGLACDVQHLRKYWAQELLVQRDYYLVAGVDKWIRTQMPQPLQHSCWTSGRPFGVQGLFVSTHHHHKPRLHTIDPSGQVRTWNGGGTAIGKDAHTIRASLYELLSENACVDSWQDACKLAIKALNFKKDDDNITVHGMVIQSNKLPSFAITQKFLQNCVEDCRAKEKQQ